MALYPLYFGFILTLFLFSPGVQGEVASCTDAFLHHPPDTCAMDQDPCSAMWCIVEAAQPSCTQEDLSSMKQWLNDTFGFGDCEEPPEEPQGPMAGCNPPDTEFCPSAPRGASYEELCRASQCYFRALGGCTDEFLSENFGKITVGLMTRNMKRVCKRVKNLNRESSCNPMAYDMCPYPANPRNPKPEEMCRSMQCMFEAFKGCTNDFVRRVTGKSLEEMHQEVARHCQM